MVVFCLILIFGDQFSFYFSSLVEGDLVCDWVVMVEVVGECDYVFYYCKKIVFLFVVMCYFVDCLCQDGWWVDYYILDQDYQDFIDVVLVSCCDSGVC